ncbi:hypothetical protein ABT404_41565, partial [Streptomyces hyaluromycini]
MGIESDQVVYEYLSRVGDIAHQRQLSSAERMRLVSGLRNDIDRQRAKARGRVHMWVDEARTGRWQASGGSADAARSAADR